MTEMVCSRLVDSRFSYRSSEFVFARFRRTGAYPLLDSRIFLSTPLLATLVFQPYGVLVGLRQLLGPGSSEITSSRFHTSSVVLAQLRRKSKKPNGKPSSPPRTRLAKSLQPTGKAKRLGKLEIAPSHPEFKRDSVPHEGLAPQQRESPPRRRTTSESRSIPKRRVPTDDADAETEVKNWAIKAHSERVDRRKVLARQPPPQVNPLEEEFDLSAPAASTSKDLPTRFSSPPLMPGLLQSLQETLGKEARPTAIQASSMKHLFKEHVEGEKYKEFLLASETGSGKSIAYLLPVLQDLKRTEHEQSNAVVHHSSRKPLNPRALILAPTHELTRQLASFAKSLSHVIKLRSSGTASKMKGKFEQAGAASDAEFVISKSSRGSRPVDLLAGTPMKLLEMERGRGWNWEERARERAMRIGKGKSEGHEDVKEEDGGNKEQPREFWVDEPEMGLENVQWVVVDEADVLFGAATIPTSLANYLSNYHPSLTRLASPRLHHLPPTLRTEHTSWTGGNKSADIERRIRRVWAEDALVHSKTATGPGPIKLSKLLVFCNKRSKVEQLAAFLDSRGIKCVALTGGADARKRGSNHHLDGFLKTGGPVPTGPGVCDPAQTPHVLVTTSLLSRGLDFSPMIKHVFIVDEPRNMIDFLHRAGRAGRAGEAGKVVVFGRAKGRGSGRTEEVKQRVKAVAG
ncbi:P-loop containing nucleoside triphosphate hydrolase protein [Suillus subalutaceus]|uniref:P-loop containing nucleoside triphosphate hydrolase protein n=1 Tax=Suillus subalutaceus TaxID=48586 RepID=UPI001B877DC9|nr:P-loop containing nucleoside triphosphate hydrolase protein [Suillus subalutaceus]KAG1834937.1 P-loop containing nucleoside triphosphate hydrolase protein [Suillus subalutaceus]